LDLTKQTEVVYNSTVLQVTVLQQAQILERLTQEMRDEDILNGLRKTWIEVS
jgi:hypothetical protein